jgi:uncharacterized membrane protein
MHLPDTRCGARPRFSGNETRTEVDPMLPQPLHPAVVHFPIVLAFLLPAAAAWAALAIRRGASSRRAWAPVGLLAALLFLSAWVSVKTGQGQEETAEDVVGESALHGHEEAAERFVIAAGVLFGLAALGLAGGRIGSAGRLAAAAGSVVALAMVVQTGHSGGQLVYRHGAAQAYVSASTGGGQQNGDARGGEREEGSEHGRSPER